MSRFLRLFQGNSRFQNMSRVFQGIYEGLESQSLRKACHCFKVSLGRSRLDSFLGMVYPLQNPKVENANVEGKPPMNI